MPRLVKRYGSRKLYDTVESRYVALDELAAWIREGADVQVVDNATSQDVTATVLTQIIAEEGRKGNSPLPKAFLHEVIRIGEEAFRVGERAVEASARHLRTTADDFVAKRLGRMPSVPVAHVRQEMDTLRQRLEALANQLDRIETDGANPEGFAPPETNQKD
ncbi:polyhydroxyalkanoate synthesis regulator DNA-binding domain-containing protein [soil metagenome]